MESPKSFAIAFSRRTVYLILAVMAFAFALAAWFVVDIARKQDRQSFVTTSHFIRVSLDAKQQWLNKMVVDYADWGTAYKHLHLTVDTVWAYYQNNIGRTLVEDLGIEYGAVFDSSGDEVYSVVDGNLMLEPAVSKLKGGVAELVKRAAATNPDGHEVVTGLLYADGEPILISASVLAVGDDSSVAPDGRPPSVLLFGDRLTKREVAQMRDGLFLKELRFTPADLNAVPPEDVFLRTSDGSAGFVLNLAAPKPGSEMLQAVLPWFAAVGLCLATFVVVLARHGLRLASLSKQVAANLAESHRLLEKQALYDPVTGLPNRVMFTRHVREVLTNTQLRASVLFLDLDRFKPVNDTFGHEAGDLVLHEIGRRILGCLGGNGFCARFGGDEFVVVVETQENAQLHRLCRRLMRAISSDIAYQDHSINVGVSIGIAPAISGVDSAEDVLRRADKALYEAKAAGRSSYRWFADSVASERATA